MNLIKGLSVSLVTGVVLFALKEASASKGSCSSEKDYLLILGCRVKGNNAEPALKMRAERAAEYLKENEAAVAIACGGIVHKDQYISEAEAIKKILTEKGIDESRIILEDKSTTTAENFINAKKLVPSLSRENAAFLSSEFHLWRGELLASKCGLPLESVAAPSPKKQRMKNYIREFFCFPMISSNVKNAIKRSEKNG